MPNRNTNLALYLAKLETTEGTDAAPVPTTDALELMEQFEPDYDNVYKNDALKRVRGPTLTPGDPLSVAGKAFSGAARKMYARGTVGLPSLANRVEADPWLQSVGLAATYDATGGAENVTYTPADSGLVTMTEYYYRDGIVYKHTGVRGELMFSFDVGGPATFELHASGRVASDIDTATPTTGVFKALDWPIATDAATFTVDGFTAGIIRHWEHSLGNSVQIRGGVKSVGGIAGWRIDNRNPTFKCILEEDTHTIKDWTLLRDNKTPLAITWTLGGVQYNKINFNATRAFIRKITPSNDNGLALVTLEGFLRSSPPLSLKFL